MKIIMFRRLNFPRKLECKVSNQQLPEKINHVREVWRLACVFWDQRLSQIVNNEQKQR